MQLSGSLRPQKEHKIWAEQQIYLEDTVKKKKNICVGKSRTVHTLIEKLIMLQQVTNFLFWIVTMSCSSPWWKTMAFGVDPFITCCTWLLFTAQVGACTWVLLTCVLQSWVFHREDHQGYFISHSTGVTHLRLKWLLPSWFSGHGFSCFIIAQGDTVIYVGNSTLSSFSVRKMCNGACQSKSVPS